MHANLLSPKAKNEKKPSDRDTSIHSFIESLSDIMNATTLQKVFAENNISLNMILDYFSEYENQETYTSFFNKIKLIWIDDSASFQKDIQIIMQIASPATKEAVFNLVLSVPFLLEDNLSSLPTNTIKSVISLLNAYCIQNTNFKLLQDFLKIFEKEPSLKEYISFFLKDFEIQVSLIPKEEKKDQVIDSIHSISNLPLDLINLAHKYKSLLEKDNLYIDIVLKLLQQIRQDRAQNPSIEDFEETCYDWDEAKELFSEAVDCFRKETISAKTFTNCLSALDPYIQDISKLNNEELQSIRRERIRDILFILHQKLPLLPLPPHPLPPSLDASPLEIVHYEDSLAQWTASIAKREEINQRHIALFLDDQAAYFYFCMFIKSLIHDLLPLQYDDKTPKNALIFKNVTLANSWIQALYDNSAVFQNYVTSYFDENNESLDCLNTIETILAKINPATSVISFTCLDEPGWSDKKRHFSVLIFSLLFEKTSLSEFNSFLNQISAISILNQPEFQDVYDFFSVLNLYLEQKKLANILPEHTLFDKNNIIKSNSEITLLNKKKETIFNAISSDDTLCKTLAKIANSVSIPLPPSPPKNKGSKPIQSETNFSKKLPILLKLCHANSTFKSTVETGQPGTLGQAIFLKSEEPNKQSTSSFRSLASLGSSLDSSESTSSQSRPRNSSFFSNQSDGSTQQTSSPSTVVSIDLLIQTYLHDESSQNWNSIITDLSTTLSNITSKKLPLSDLFPILNELEKVFEKESNKISEVLDIIEARLCQLKIPTVDAISKNTTKKSYFFWAKNSQTNKKAEEIDNKDAKKLVEEKIQLIQQTNTRRTEMVNLLTINEEFCSQLASLVKRMPHFTVNTVEKITINGKKFSDTIFNKFNTNDSVFKQKLNEVEEAPTMDNDNDLRYSHSR